MWNIYEIYKSLYSVFNMYSAERPDFFKSRVVFFLLLILSVYFVFLSSVVL